MSLIRRHRLLLLALAAAWLLACQIGPRPATPIPAQVTASPTPSPMGQKPLPPPTVGLSPTAGLSPTVRLSPTAKPAPTHTPTASPTPSPTVQPTPTPSPTPPLPNAGPLPAAWREIDLSRRHPALEGPDATAGGVYEPQALAIDDGAGLGYVLGRCEPYALHRDDAPQTCIAALDLNTNQVVQRTALSAPYDGDLILAPDTLYLHHSWSGELYTLDRAALQVRSAISDVLAIAFDGAGTAYALTPQGLARLHPDPQVHPLETSSTDYAIAMQADAERVYLLSSESLRVFDTELNPVAAFDLQEASPRAMVLDAAHGRLYVGCHDGLYVLNTASGEIAKTPYAIRGIRSMVLDPSGRHLYALVWRMPEWFGRTEVVALDLAPDQAQAGAEPRVLYTTLEGQLRDVALDNSGGRLLIASYDDHALIPIDLPSGQVGPRLPLGIELSEVIVDEAGESLYVSDSAGWIHALDRRTYEQVGRAYGGRHISLDATHRRLYAGDPRVPVVRAYAITAAGSLTLLHEIPQAGKPRANAFTGEVVIVGRRFHVYDGASGELTGELLPGIGVPPAECLGCYYTIAREVIIDGRRGLTATVTYTPWPGKPGPSESIAHDPFSGRAYYALLTGGYVHYSSIATYPDLSALQQRKQPVLHLEGLSGYIQLDPPARRLYVARGRTLYVLDSETLNRVGRVHTAGWTPFIAALDGELGRLYTPVGDKLVVWAREGAAPPVPLPPERAVVSGTVAAILPSPDFAADRTLLATIDGKLCRSTDGGETWQRLRGGLPEHEGYAYGIEVTFSPDYANDRTLFAGIYLGDTLGEGVYRSRDGGETWVLASDGLYDLRVQRISASPDYAHDRTLLAYAHTPQGQAVYRSPDGGDTWQLVFRQTSYSTPPLPRPEALFSPAEDYAPQFECDYEGNCQRSDDGGESWVKLDMGRAVLKEWVAYALSPDYARDHTVYLLTRSDLYRYQGDRGTWSLCTLPLFGGRDYRRSLTSLATAATAAAEHALFVSSIDGEFHRFAASDLPWASLEPETISPSPTATATPCAQDFDERFGIDYTKTSARLGCASEPGRETGMVFQPFERGLMFWRQDTRQIYALQEDGVWRAYPDTWVEGQPDRDPAMVPPKGLYQPVRGFGAVWREQLGGAEAAIGWATAPEHGFAGLAQSFTAGLLLQGESGVLYILYADGTWESASVVDQR